MILLAFLSSCFLVSLFSFFFVKDHIGGSPRGLGEQGNIGKISKGTREHEPIFREQENKTVQIRG